MSKKINSWPNLCGIEKMYEIIERWEEYKEARMNFDMNHGILQPIRAIVKTYAYGTLLEDVVDTAMYVQDLNRSLSNRYADQKSCIKEFCNRSTTVGYFSAEAIGNGNYKIGCSFCRPKDYSNSSGWVGQLITITKDRFITSNLYDFDHQLVEFTGFEEQFLNIPYLQNIATKLFTADMAEDSNTCVAYYFPIELDEQFAYFIHRCLRYYRLLPEKSSK